MRFASKSQAYKREVIKPLFTIVQGPNGPEHKATRNSYIAQFRQAGLTPFEREQCKARFNFLGQYEGEDPLRRVSLYDTDIDAEINGWDAETKASVEANLLEGQNEWYFLLDEQRAATPWPSYDKQTPKQVLDTIAVTGANVEDVIVYERENKNRTTLIADLEALIAEDSEPLVTA